MSDQWLQCLVCDRQYPVGPLFHGCPECRAAGRRAAVEMRYDYRSVAALTPDETAPGLWRWRGLLPHGRTTPVSLGEGGTPLRRVPFPRDGIRLLVKNETTNPTWSYKDRASSVTVTMARELGFKQVASVSTGNLGGATAAYASAAGLRCAVFCHAEASASQFALIRLYGAQVFRGGDRFEMLRRLLVNGCWYPSYILEPIEGFCNPFGIEGYKTIAFELFHELGRVPDRVFVPLGSGDGLYGIWKGFVEMKRVGLTDRLPRMIGCQAEGAAPYARAFDGRLAEMEPVPHPRTIALSICEPVGNRQALQALRDSDGAAIAVSDEEILAAASELGRCGYAMEPASAAAFACARKVERRGGEDEQTWVMIGTGAFAKWQESLGALFEPVSTLAADFDRVEELGLLE